MKPLVLVLDDQVRYTHALQRAIGRDFDVVTAASVQEGQERMSAGVALVVTDIRLDETIPDDRQGLDFIRWVRAAQPTLPVVAISALNDPDVEGAALAAGATRFLRKPVSVSALRDMLGELLAG